MHKLRIMVKFLKLTKFLVPLSNGFKYMYMYSDFIHFVKGIQQYIHLYQWKKMPFSSNKKYENE